MKRPVLLLVCSVLSTAMMAQSITSSVINTAGNTYTQGYYRLDCSVGEMGIIESMYSSNGVATITNGFLQPNSPPQSTTRNFTADEVKIFPNPTYNHFEINFLTTQQGTLSIAIYDALGKNIILRKTVSYGIGSIEHFNLSQFASGTYFIRIDLIPVPGSVSKTGMYKIVKMS